MPLLLLLPLAAGCGSGGEKASNRAAQTTSAGIQDGKPAGNAESGVEADSRVEQDSFAESELTEEEVVFAPKAETSSGKDDPSKDGWTTETLSSDASSKLNVLGELLAGGDVSFDGLIDPDFKAGLLVPLSSQTEVIFQDNLLSVRRLAEQPDSSAADAVATPRHEWLSALRSYRKVWEGFNDLHYKFKLYRVGVDKDVIWTRQYVHFSGSNRQGFREQNSTWLAHWRANESKQLVLTSIELEAFEEVTSQQSEPLMQDITALALGECETYQTCSLLGIGDWRKRLESRLGVLNFGHHGLAVADIDGDLLDDLYVCETGGLPNHTYIRNKDGTFTDRTQSSGLNYLDNTRSALFVDLDNDGDQDAILAFGAGVVALENNGEGVFAERARIASIRDGFSMSAGDYDSDGLLDIFVNVYYGVGDTASELPAPVPYFDATNGGQNVLIRNLGNWRFRNETERAGLDVDNRRYSYASAWEDFDNDGDLDLLVVNDFGPNQLYANDSGKFTDVARDVGLVDGAFGMSATYGDYDHNGSMDIYVSNMFSAAGNRVTFQPQFKTESVAGTREKFQHLARGNSLFRNDGGEFKDVSIPAGVTMGRWSWGSLFADINNDGWKDLLVGNGFVTGDLPDDL